MRGGLGPDRVWLLGGAVAAVVVLAIAWFTALGPELSGTGELREETTQAQDENVVRQAEVAALQNEYNDLANLKVELNRVREGLPDGSGLPDLTRQLTRQAAAAEVELTSITTADPVVAGDPADVAAQATDPEPAAPADPTAPAPDADATDAVETAAAPPQLLAIPMTIVVRGRYDGHRAFLDAVQVDGPRRSLVSSVVFAPADGSSAASIDASTTMTLEMQVFVAPRPS